MTNADGRSTQGLEGPAPLHARRRAPRPRMGRGAAAHATRRHPPGHPLDPGRGAGPRLRGDEPARGAQRRELAARAPARSTPPSRCWRTKAWSAPRPRTALASYQLTEAGRVEAAADAAEGRPPWERGDNGDGVAALREATFGRDGGGPPGLGTGSPEQVDRAVEIVDGARASSTSSSPAIEPRPAKRTRPRPQARACPPPPPRPPIPSATGRRRRDHEIQTIGLTKVYAGTDFRAVDSLDLTSGPARSSDCSVRTGPGKTTTAGMLTTRVVPTSGSAFVGGIDVVGTRRWPSRSSGS